MSNPLVCTRCGYVHPFGMEGGSCLEAARVDVQLDRRFYDVPLGEGSGFIVERQGNQLVQAVLVLTNGSGASFPGIPMTAEQLAAFAHKVQSLSLFPMSTLAEEKEVLTLPHDWKPQEGTGHAAG